MNESAEKVWIPAETDEKTKVTWWSGVAHVKCACGQFVRVDTKEFSAACRQCGREYHISFVVETRES
jgi:hypothetical protein